MKCKMFVIFVNFAICVFILPYICTSPRTSDGRARTPSIRKQVQDELTPIKNLLKKIMDSKTDNSEKFLLQGELQGKVEKIIERAIKADGLLKDVGALENGMLHILLITKRLACAKNLRYALEVFKDNYLLVPTDGFQKRDKILKLLRILFDNRRIRLTNILLELSNDVYNSNSQKDKDQMLASLVKQLTELIINVPESVSVSVPLTNVQHQTPPAQKMNLTTALIQLCNAKELPEIKTVRAGQAEFWRNFDMNTDEIEDQIKSLSAKLPEKEVEKLLLKETDIDCENKYAHDTVRVGRIFRQKVTTKYIDCSWIMYTSMEPEITEIENKLNEQWPDISDMQRKDRFCYSFSELHHFLSIPEFHSPDPDLLPPDCKPNTEDYISYINSIAAKAGQSDMALVGLLIGQLPLPPTTMKPAATTNFST